jgi:hypothetical protein
VLSGYEPTRKALIKRMVYMFFGDSVHNKREKQGEVAWAAVIQCSANEDCFGTNQADTLTGTSGGDRIFGVGGAVLAQNQHYRQLHDLKLGRYDAGDLS